MTLKIQFNHLMQTVTCKAPMLRVYSRLSDRKVVSVHRLPSQIQQCTFTPDAVNKAARTVRLVSTTYETLMRNIERDAVVRF